MIKPNTDMIPPHSIELEETILSTCFIAGGEVLSEIVGLVSRDYFYTLAHKEIYSAIQDVAMHADSADLVSVMTILKDNGLLNKVGGATYLSQLIDLPIAVDVEYSCKKLEEKYLLRKTIEKCYATIKKCHKESDFEQVMNYYVESAHSVSDGSKAGDPVVSMKEISMEASDVYAMRYKSKKVVTGVASGLHDLDALTFGFHPGDLTILAARPAMGKTALALNICRHAAQKGIASVFMSLEMPRIQLCDRIITMETEINGNIVRIGRFTPDEFQRVNDACSKVYDMPIYIDDRGGLEFNEVRRVIRRQAKLHPEIKFAIIDHLQLVRGRNQQNRNLELGEISGGLKALAKELRIAIICLSQLNRGLESRNNPYKRPKLSDLRDSGSIEQDADNVIFIYRPWVYGDTKDPVNPEVELQIEEEDCELIVAKQRQGATGTARCMFYEKIQRFRSYSKLSPDEIYKQRGVK